MAVEDRIASARKRGRLIVSPSQLDFYRDCKRKWAWRYIARIPTAPNPWAALGSAVHKVLEDWLRDGTPPDRNTEVGAIALSGIKHLPDPGTVQVEGRFLWELPNEPFDVQGVIDWTQVQEALFGDHKTTGDFKWAKTPEDLRSDLQSTIYAAYLIESNGLDAITGRWVYYRTKGRRASKKVEWQITREELQEPLQTMLTMGREMAQLYAARPDPKSLEPNAEACDHYGGCAFRGNCDLSSQERFKALMSHMSLKEKMRQKRAERSGVTPPPVVGIHEPPSTLPPEGATPAAAPAPSPAPSAVDRARALRERMAAQVAKRSTPEPVAPRSKPDLSPPAPEPTPGPAPQGGLKAKMAAKAKAKAVAGDSPAVPPPPEPTPAPAPVSADPGAGAPMTLREKMAATLKARAATEPPPMVPPSADLPSIHPPPFPCTTDPVVPEEGQVAINPPEAPPPPPPPEEVPPPEPKAKKGKVVIRKKAAAKAKAKPSPEPEIEELTNGAHADGLQTHATEPEAVPPPEQEPVISELITASELKALTEAVIEARPPVPRPPEPPRPPVPYRDPAGGPDQTEIDQALEKLEEVPDPLPQSSHTDEKGQEHTNKNQEAADPGPPSDMPPPQVPDQQIDPSKAVLTIGSATVPTQEIAALYVDCAPLKADGAVVPVSRILQAVPKGQTLAEAIGQTVHLQGCSVTMSMRTPGALEIYDTLSALARTVVRGF